MNQINQKIDLHHELAKMNHEYPNNFNIPEVEKIKKIYCYIDLQSDKIKNDLRVNLLKDIKTIQYESHPRFFFLFTININLFRPDLDVAFKDLYERQNSKIIKINEIIKNKILNLKRNFNKDNNEEVFDKKANSSYERIQEKYENV